MGSKLASYDTLNATQGLFVEASSYGTNIVGRVDLESGTRKVLYEGRERIRILDTSDPVIILAATSGKTKIVNAVTGASRTLSYELDGRRAGESVLLWTPSTAPKAVWLMSPKDWEIQARWRSE